MGFGTWGLGTLAMLHDYLGIKSKDARVIKLFGRETCSGVYWGVRWWAPSCAPATAQAGMMGMIRNYLDTLKFLKIQNI